MSNYTTFSLMSNPDLELTLSSFKMNKAVMFHLAYQPYVLHESNDVFLKLERISQLIEAIETELKKRGE